ncbi:MAG: phytanoyl-CoA dioxygenase family protein [Alphaproteobacteria bacterium]
MDDATVRTPRTVETEGPDGVPVRVPATPADDPDGLSPGDPRIRDRFQSEGYVVVRGLVPPAQCAAAAAAFDREVRPYPGFLYRQTTGEAERHRWTAGGHLINPLLNVQSLPAATFPGFRAAGLAILTHAGMQQAGGAILGAPPTLVQSMYFEGNPVTWAHQDSYYLDSERIGTMVAAWVAVEEIAPTAGRFYVYAGSHRVDPPRHGGDISIAYSHDRYKSLVRRLVAEEGLALRAPALGPGDVLLWAAKTIHGSLPTTDVTRSRRSFTAHYIAAGDRFLQFQRRVRPLRLATVGGMAVHRPKDLNRALPRAVLALEGRFPRACRIAKKAAIKLVTR